MNEENKTQEEDWRHDFVGTVLDDKAKIHGFKKGDVIKKISGKAVGKEQLSFGIPSAAALYLEISDKAFGEAFRLKKMAFTRTNKNEMRPEFIFEYFEQMAVAVVFGYTALEAFANVCIPEAYYFEKKHKEIYAALGKENIERQVDLETKLRKILPEVLKSEKIAGTKLWQDFRYLKEIRDRFIHIKSFESHSLHPDPKSVWDQLAKEEIKSPAKISYEIISHYLKGKSENEHPWWFKKIPLFK